MYDFYLQEYLDLDAVGDAPIHTFMETEFDSGNSSQYSHTSHTSRHTSSSESTVWCATYRLWNSATDWMTRLWNSDLLLRRAGSFIKSKKRLVNQHNETGAGNLFYKTFCWDFAFFYWPDLVYSDCGVCRRHPVSGYWCQPWELMESLEALRQELTSD